MLNHELHPSALAHPSMSLRHRGRSVAFWVSYSCGVKR
jgi:hypothetical protein